MNTSWKSVSPDVVRGFCGAQDLDVSIPANASVDIKARSLKGKSEQAASNVDGVVPTDQKSLFLKPGVAGASRVVLRSFKGRIRLKRP